MKKNYIVPEMKVRAIALHQMIATSLDLGDKKDSDLDPSGKDDFDLDLDWSFDDFE